VQGPIDVPTTYYIANFGSLSRLVAFRRNGTLYYVGTDHLGGTIRVADVNFSPLDQMRYTPFGVARDNGSSLNTDHLFTAQVEDQAIGIYWFGSRAYDAAIGRFLQPDTVVPSPTNPQALNRYSYVLNAPLRHFDPTGHMYDDPSDGSFGNGGDDGSDGSSDGSGSADSNGDTGGDGSPDSNPSPDAPPEPTPDPTGDPTASSSPTPGGPPTPANTPTPSTTPSAPVSTSPTVAPSPAPTSTPEPAATPTMYNYNIDLGDGVTLTVNDTNLEGQIALALGGPGNNMTLSGHWIVSPGQSRVTEPSLYGTMLRMHEMGHVAQARDLGILYLPTYVLLTGVTVVRLAVAEHRIPTGREVHRFHPMEVNANERSRLPRDFQEPLSLGP